MRLSLGIQSAERCLRWAGGVGALAMTWIALRGVQRSTRRAKGRASGRVPGILKGYQSGALTFYLPTATISLGLLYLLWKPMRLKLPLWVQWTSLTGGSLLYFPGLCLFFWGRKSMGEMYNVSSTFGAQLYAGHQLITSGPFAYVRHPMYLGGMMVEVGSLLLYRTWGTLLIALACVLLPIRARREEQALAAEFGNHWEDYCRRTRAGIPFVG